MNKFTLALSCLLVSAGGLCAADAPRATAAPAAPPAPISLFNGRDFTGLHVYVENATVETAWAISDGILHCTGLGKGYARTEIPYADYKLSLEWRWPKNGGNSGILLNMVNGDKLWPKGFEAQLASGRVGDFASYSDARSKEELVSHNPTGVSTGRLSRPGPSAEKPVGEWNKFEITVSGGTITLVVNGVEVNHMTEVLPSAGTVGFQSEGAAVDFRNMTLTPLPPFKDLNAPMPPRAGGPAQGSKK